MGFDGLDEVQVELLYQRRVAVHLLQHGVDDQSVTAATAGKQVWVGARRLVEKLAEDHGGRRPSWALARQDSTRSCWRSSPSGLVRNGRIHVDVHGFDAG